MDRAARHELMDRIADLLGEHGYGFVYAMVVPDEEDDGHATRVLMDYRGNLPQAQGLAGMLNRHLAKEESYGDMQAELEGDDEDGDETPESPAPAE